MWLIFGLILFIFSVAGICIYGCWSDHQKAIFIDKHYTQEVWKSMNMWFVPDPDFDPELDEGELEMIEQHYEFKILYSPTLNKYHLSCDYDTSDSTDEQVAKREQAMADAENMFKKLQLLEPITIWNDISKNFQNRILDGDIVTNYEIAHFTKDSSLWKVSNYYMHTLQYEPEKIYYVKKNIIA